jgi:GT2 family glycosyltransferase
VEHDHAHSGVYRLTPALHETPLVSIIIPTAGLARVVRGETMNLVLNCVESILSQSTYREYEVICVIDGQTSEDTRNALMSSGDPRLRLVEYLLAFNFARKINFGAAHSRGDYLLLLNDDTQVITPNWIESMLCYAQSDRVGAVGAKLLFSDGRIQHVGVVAVDGNPGHPYYNFPADSTGYANNLLVPQNYAAVTAACLMSPRRAFEEVGGLSLSFPMNYNDVDYCLKLRHLGYRVVFNPEAELYHYEASSRMTGEVADEELHLLQSRWGSILRNDPYYNPNFIDGSANFVHPVYLSDGSKLPA